jgi:hypothetical protein
VLRSAWVILAAIAAALGGAVPPTAAHHSQAMFDPAKRIALTGTVKQFAWKNPHISLTLMAPDEDGALVEWTLEGGDISQLRRRGWRRNSLVPGEKVTAIIHPLRSGAPGGVMTRVTRADGSVVGRPPSAPARD